MSPFDYINYSRIERAKKILENEDLNILEVSVEVGFSNYNGFIRNFKKFTGMTPGQYRDSLNTK